MFLGVFMRCPSYGKEVLSYARFCPFCGARLRVRSERLEEEVKLPPILTPIKGEDIHQKEIFTLYCAHCGRDLPCYIAKKVVDGSTSISISV